MPNHIHMWRNCILDERLCVQQLVQHMEILLEYVKNHIHQREFEFVTLASWKWKEKIIFIHFSLRKFEKCHQFYVFKENSLIDTMSSRCNPILIDNCSSASMCTWKTEKWSSSYWYLPRPSSKWCIFTTNNSNFRSSNRR